MLLGDACTVVVIFAGAQEGTEELGEEKEKKSSILPPSCEQVSKKWGQYCFAVEGFFGSHAFRMSEDTPTHKTNGALAYVREHRIHKIRIY